MNSTTGSGGWLSCRAARRNPRLRMFCVPFAGTGASAFNAWSSVFPDTVEVHAIQLPGREWRYSEPPLSDAYNAACLLADAIEPYLDRCYAFFGYSMGALVAFEVIRELRRRGAPMPAQLFVCARRAPQLAAAQPPLGQLPNEAFLEGVSEYYDCPVTLWRNPDLVEIVLPVLRADMALCERYVYRRELPFDFPIQALAGRRDRSAPFSDVAAWREQTTGEFALEVFDGAHFFLNASLTRVQQLIIVRLERLMRQASS